MEPNKLGGIVYIVFGTTIPRRTVMRLVPEQDLRGQTPGPHLKQKATDLGDQIRPIILLPK